MIITPDEARQNICKVQKAAMRPTIKPTDTPCLAEKCMTYWRWADEGHMKGYCSITGKPEF